MQTMVNVSDTLTQSYIQRETKQVEEKLKKQVEDDVAGSFKKYANSYIPTSQAVKQAWNEIINEKYNSN